MTNHLNNPKDSISSGAASIKWNNTSITQEKWDKRNLTHVWKTGSTIQGSFSSACFLCKSLWLIEMYMNCLEDSFNHRGAETTGFDTSEHRHLCQARPKYQFSWLWRVIGEGFGPRHDEAEKTESVIGRTLIFLPNFYSTGNSCNSHSGWKVVWCFQLHMRLQSPRLSSNLTANCSRWNDELVVIEFLATVRHWEHRLIVMMISVTVQAWTDR